MDFFGAGIPIGRYFGINVRLHWTLLLVALYYGRSLENPGIAAVVIIGLYVCILLHEFGHALMARWCGGEANEIVLWPLGGLAFCRPPFNATAHLLTTVGGPVVTLLLWILFATLTRVLHDPGLLHDGTAMPVTQVYAYYFCHIMAMANRLLLVFNLVPAFPMDGGRILRDTLWHLIGVRKATLTAVRVSQLIAVVVIIWSISQQNYWRIVIALFILGQANQTRRSLAAIPPVEEKFSFKGPWRRAPKTDRPPDDDAELIDANNSASAFHGCHICGKNERGFPTMDFRVCTECANGQEYCPDHLEQHVHV